MRVVYDKPPMFDEIAKAFDLTGTKPIFAFGSVIYQPFDQKPLGPALMAHESVHGLRQGTLIETWWRQYIDDPVFRLGEEIAAHRAELGVHYLQSEDRSERRRWLTHVAARLCSRLYAYPPGLITFERAKKVLREEF